MIQGQYTGKLIEGVREGFGKLEWSNGDVYEGIDNHARYHTVRV
jgi:hypothetical protein